MRFAVFSLAILLSSASGVLAQTGAAPPAPPPATALPPAPPAPPVLSGYDIAVPIDPSLKTTPADLPVLDDQLRSDEVIMTGLRDKELLQEKGRIWQLQPGLAFHRRFPLNCLPFEKKCRPAESITTAVLTAHDKAALRREYARTGPEPQSFGLVRVFRCLPFRKKC